MLDTRKAIGAVTLEEAKRHLRVEHDADDELIKTLILAVTQMCEHEILHAIVDREGYNGFCPDVEHVPAPIKQWCLLYIGTLYEVRGLANLQDLESTSSMDALLDPYRWQK